jgi:Na+-translocating ferredoxin:NAD+ oxidoreductase RnfG subunit
MTTKIVVTIATLISVSLFISAIIFSASKSTVQQQTQLQAPVKASETEMSREERQEKMAEKCLHLKEKAANISSLLNDTLDNPEAVKKVLSDPELKKKYQDLSDISNRIRQDRIDNCGYVPKKY